MIEGLYLWKVYRPTGRFPFQSYILLSLLSELNLTLNMTGASILFNKFYLS